MLCLIAPAAPVTVTLYAPCLVVAVVATVSVEDPVEGTVTGSGSNVPVASGGRPLTLRSIGPVDERDG